MKNLRWFISIIFLLSSLHAAGQSGSSSLDAATIDPSSSKGIRRDKTYSVQGKIFGTGSNATTEKGLAVGYYISPDQELLLEYSIGDNMWAGSYYSNVDTRSLSFSYREFLGNSFYAKLGLEYTRLDYRWNDYVDGYSFDADRLAGKFAIGNQWQWNNFTFGVDWISITVPITTSFSNEKSSSERWSSMQSGKDSISKWNYVAGLNVYVGATF